MLLEASYLTLTEQMLNTEQSLKGNDARHETAAIKLSLRHTGYAADEQPHAYMVYYPHVRRHTPDRLGVQVSAVGLNCMQIRKLYHQGRYNSIDVDRWLHGGWMIHTRELSRFGSLAKKLQIDMGHCSLRAIHAPG